MRNRDTYWKVMDNLLWGMSTSVEPGLRTADPIEKVLLWDVQHPSNDLFFAVSPINLFYAEESCLLIATKIQLGRRSRDKTQTKVRTMNKDVCQKVQSSFDQVEWSLMADRTVALSAITLVSSVVGNHGGLSITTALK